MTQLKADEVLTQRLQGILEPVEICDTSGKVIGVYTPVLEVSLAELQAQARELFDLDEATMVAATEQGQYTTAEILEYVRTIH
jgi:hypothetical protein